EQLEDGEIDGRSDIFSLGLVAYHVLTGINLLAPPPRVSLDEAVAYVLSRLREHPIVPPHLVRPDVPETLSLIVMKMLAIDPDKRYADMEECGNDFEKKYLYAEGFGPTNNSLAAYLRLFEGDFQNPAK